MNQNVALLLNIHAQFSLNKYHIDITRQNIINCGIFTYKLSI